MPDSASDKKRVTARLRRIQGQAQALERAVTEGVACAQLLQQLAALRGAATSLMTEVLEMHLRDTFIQPPEAAAARRQPLPALQGEPAIDEIMRIVRAYVR